MADEKAPGPDLSGRTSFIGKVDAAMRAAANFITLGYADKLDSLMSSGSYADNMVRNKAINEFDEKNNSDAVLAGQVGITAVSVVPNVVKAAALKTTQAVARLAGRKAVVAEAAPAARAAANVAETVASAAPAATNAAKAAPLASRAAAVVKEAVTHPLKTSGKVVGKTAKLATQTGKLAAQTGIAIAVPLAVANSIVATATDIADDGKPEPQTVAEATARDNSVMSGGVVAATAVGVLADAAPVIQKAAVATGEKLAEGLGGRFSGLIRLGGKLAEKMPKSVTGLAGYTLHAAQSGATTVARFLGLSMAGGEIIGSAYVSQVDNGQKTTLTESVNAIRDVYTDVREYGRSLKDDGSPLGYLGTGLVDMTNEAVEGFVPGVGSIVAKEKQMLLAQDADFSKPEMRALLDKHIRDGVHGVKQENLVDHASDIIAGRLVDGAALKAEEWANLRRQLTEEELKKYPNYKAYIRAHEMMQDQGMKIEKLYAEWAPAMDKLDAFLNSDKADLRDPAILNLIAERRDQNYAVIEGRFTQRAMEKGTYNARKNEYVFDSNADKKVALEERQKLRDQMKQKWQPFETRLAALYPTGPAVAEAPDASGHSVILASFDVQAEPAPKVVHHGRAKPATPQPHDNFNQQSTSAIPASQAPEGVDLSALAATTAQQPGGAGGLVPDTLPAPPLVAPSGTPVTQVDTSALQLGEETPEPAEKRPTHALNTRTSGPGYA